MAAWRRVDDGCGDPRRPQRLAVAPGGSRWTISRVEPADHPLAVVRAALAVRRCVYEY
jgi:hypothetical protein